MFDTYVTIVGNVLNLPEWRRTNNTGAVVVSFKIASTARRLNRETGQWVDGNSLRVRVTCWRRLAEGVGASVKTGDPVVVVGRLYTREWEDENGARRLAYEVDAVAVGHDLSKGRAQFVRVKPSLGTSMVEDEDGEVRAGGELTSALAPDEVPVRPPSDLDPDLDPDRSWPESPYDPLAGLSDTAPDPTRIDASPLRDASTLRDVSTLRDASTLRDVSTLRDASTLEHPDSSLRDGIKDGSNDDFRGAAEEASPDTGEDPAGGPADGEPSRRRRGSGRQPVPA